jgi:plastocyanin
MPKIALLAAALAAAWPTLARAGEATIEIRDMRFTPAELTIAPGTRVTWINEDNQPHTVTDRGRAFHSAALDTKERFSYTFARPGEFAYFCTIHPMMVGRIVVTPARPPS